MFDLVSFKPPLVVSCLAIGYLRNWVSLKLRLGCYLQIARTQGRLALAAAD